MSESSEPTDPQTADGPSLADRVNQLFHTLRPSGTSTGREYTPEEVARAIGEAGGPTISATYIYMLRKGLRDNPTKKHLEALAAFFRVSPSYFFDEDEGQQIHAELALMAALRDADVASVALRASGLSAGSLDAIRTMIVQARRLEGLPTEPTERTEVPPTSKPPGSGR